MHDLVDSSDFVGSTGREVGAERLFGGGAGRGKTLRLSPGRSDTERGFCDGLRFERSIAEMPGFCAFGFDVFFVVSVAVLFGCAGGPREALSLSRSSMQKLRSWVEIGGIRSAFTNGSTIGALNDLVTGCRGSSDNSLAICEPLSRKSSHPSRKCSGKDATDLGMGLCASSVDELNFDAGMPGTLKPGFRSTCLISSVSRDNIPGTLDTRVRLSIAGILKPDWAVSCGKVAHV